MLDWFRARTRNRRKATEIYGAVVAAARSPAYYSDLRVPDTPEGRFEMVALVLFLVLERLKCAEPSGQALAQSVIEAFVTDMDDCLREMGVGDLGVPKKVKRTAAAFYERGGAYRAALASGREADLAACLRRFVYRDEHDGAEHGLAEIVSAQAKSIALAADRSIYEGNTLVALFKLAGGGTGRFGG